MTASIQLKNVIVDFPIYGTSHTRSLKSTLIRAATGGLIAQSASGFITVRALNDVNFTLKPGDRVGLMGHNGSGKTTLLRVLGGIYEPSEGQIDIRGRVASLLDLAMGIDTDATGYENIFLRGLLLGLSRQEINEKMEEISEFSELGGYLAMPVRTYSIGMLMRLAFSVSTCISADILLMDEWLSVGDADFQAKAEARLEELIDKTSILVIASQSEQMLDRHCNRKFFLQNGQITEVF